MGTKWCVENSLRWCSVHSLHAHSLVHDLCLVRLPSRVQRPVSVPSFSVPPSTDDDTAQYLFEAFATSGQDRWSRRSSTDIKNALEETRTRKETMELGFEDRISAALLILGV